MHKKYYMNNDDAEYGIQNWAYSVKSKLNKLGLVEELRAKKLQV